jgi:phage portal protein BeeE
MMRIFQYQNFINRQNRPEFQKLVEQNLFAIMKGNFFALKVKRIREKPKNDPPYSPIRPKSQIFNIGHDYALWIRNFMVMMKKSENPDVESTMAHGQNPA